MATKTTPKSTVARKRSSKKRTRIMAAIVAHTHVRCIAAGTVCTCGGRTCYHQHGYC